MQYVQKKYGSDDVNYNFANSKIEFSSELSEDLTSDLQKYLDSIEDGVKVHSEFSISKDTKEENKIDARVIRILVGIVGLILSFLLKGDILPNYIYVGLLLSLYLISANVVIKRSIKNIIRLKPFDENFLMFVATLGAFLLGEFSEAIAVIVFYETGEYFQQRAVDNSRKSIKGIIESKISTAVKLVDGKKIEVKPSDIKKGDILSVNLGEMLAVDAILNEERASFDTSVITGESKPRTFVQGQTILSGFMPVSGPVQATALNLYKNSSVNKIMEMVEESAGKKAKTEKKITKFANYYTPIVVSLAIFIAVFMPIILDESFSVWLYRAFTFLVISCPCALVLSIPLTYFGAIGVASKYGILLKGGTYLESLEKIDTIVFDKTGTLTDGKYQVLAVETADEFCKKELIKLSAIAESFSSHPVAIAIKSNYKGDVEAGKNYKETAGQGVTTTYDGKVIKVGRKNYVSDVARKFELDDMKGASLVYVSVDGEIKGVIALGDHVKTNVKSMIEDIKSRSKDIAIFTGDKKDSADKLGADLIIDKVYAELLPKDKLDLLENFINEDKRNVLFMGDGVNDSPVLARADVGVSMGENGSDIAIESADVVVMNDDPNMLVKLFEISKRTSLLVRENISFILFIKFAFLSLSAMGLATMWMAIFADVGVSILAVVNSSRILRS